MLNDLDPNNIEDVEIVKGPSAATLYGTDAANGVIVITTKRGRAGNTRWTWYGEQGTVDDRNTYPASYASWGHSAHDGNCALLAGDDQRPVAACVDSLTSFNVLRNPSTTPVPHGQSQRLRDAGERRVGPGALLRQRRLQNEIGPVKMPEFAQATLVDSMGTPMRDEWLHPEAFQSYGLRTNLSASLTPSST